MAIEVLLLDDHPIVREGLTALIGTAGDMEIVGQAGDGFEALALVDRLKPDVIVCDIGVPGMNGLDVIRRLQQLAATRALVLSMYHDPSWIQNALKAGAAGYLIKGSDLQYLLSAIRTIATGERFLSQRAQAAAQAPELSRREREVLSEIARGLRNWEIAEVLSISRRTVECHRARVMAKLNIKSVAGLTRFAVRQGLVQL